MNSTTANAAQTIIFMNPAAAVALASSLLAELIFTATGLTIFYAIEFGDGHANTFNTNSSNRLSFKAWL
jgi:hypothetical protein